MIIDPCYMLIIVLRNQCDYDNIIHRPLANPYINDHFYNIHCLFSQNDNFRLNTLLHGGLQLYFALDTFVDPDGLKMIM